MLFRLIETDEGFKPYITTQHYSESRDEWIGTGIGEGREPMPVSLLREKVYKNHLEAIDEFKTDSQVYLSNAIETMRNLLDEST